MSTIQTAGEIAAGPQPRLAALAERRWFVVAVYLALTAVALYPIFSVTVPPLVDYPNHLARMHILATWDSDPALQKNYVINWSLHPNMAMDLIVPLLAKVMPIYMAGKIFIAMTMLSLLGGTLALRKASVGRIGLWPVLTFLVLYNLVLFWGFLNYLFTAGLALGAFAGWIALRNKPVWARIATFSAVAFILYVGHLFGLFVYGLLVAGYELRRMEALDGFRERFKAGSIMVLPFVLPLVLFVAWLAGNSNSDPAINRFGSLVEKFAALTSPANFGMPSADLPTVVFLGVAFLACRATAGIRLRPELRYAVLLLIVAAVAMPNYLMGVWGTDLRLPIVVACVMIAGVAFETGSEKVRSRLVAAALVLFVIRTAAITHSWQDIDRKFDAFRAASVAVPVGSKLMVVADSEDLPAGNLPGYGKIFQHMASLAVIERSVFLPTIFTGHTSIDAAPVHRLINSPVGNPVNRYMLRTDAETATARFPVGYHHSRYIWTYWVGWPEHFDYLVSIRFGNDVNPDPDRLRKIAEGSFVDFYQIKREDARKP